MNVVLLLVGKTQEAYLREGLLLYEKRLVRYVNFSRIEIPDIKNSASLSFEQIKEREGELILKQLGPQDTLVLWDQRGRVLTSLGMAQLIEQHCINSTRNLVLAVGGPYGFSQKVYQRAQDKWSLSPLTFSHQMVRLLCLEQLYRSFTIIKGEPYHHE